VKEAVIQNGRTLKQNRQMVQSAVKEAVMQNGFRETPAIRGVVQSAVKGAVMQNRQICFR